MQGNSFWFLIVLGFSTIALTQPQRASAGPQQAMVNASGHPLQSIFEGLKPDRSFLLARTSHLQWPRQPWYGIGLSRLPGLRRVDFTEGSCPTSVCSGNYNNFEQSGGCLADTCNPVFNAVTDLTAPCINGTMDEECGDGTVCCADAQFCPNYRGC